jgi:hypothetical protein
VTASEIGTETGRGTGKGTEIGTGKGRGNENENGKERPDQLWPFLLVLAQPPFLKTTVTAIVSKARSITVTATATATETEIVIVTVTVSAQERAPIPPRLLLPRPPFRPCENLVLAHQ